MLTGTSRLPLIIGFLATGLTLLFFDGNIGYPEYGLWVMIFPVIASLLECRVFFDTNFMSLNWSNGTSTSKNHEENLCNSYLIIKRICEFNNPNNLNNVIEARKRSNGIEFFRKGVSGRSPYFIAKTIKIWTTVMMSIGCTCLILMTSSTRLSKISFEGTRGFIAKIVMTPPFAFLVMACLEIMAYICLSIIMYWVLSNLILILKR
ncbi:hypothetical protein [Burkholderia cenocepacia]|uniref:hypothetical protein n=1 Tax=Burkholderia cenocepacia TaxID=95486 RepID=UPI0026567E6D|nr:hypothetical protein [Burkholderia cenocepacia]MDN7452315.1 hypothetical protein [Burkholderia cenocepacia]